MVRKLRPQFIALLALVCGTSSSHAAVDPPEPGLRRVIQLARHGNRAPNAMIREICPVYGREVLPKFGVEPGALSRVGMAECDQSGRHIRERYRDFLPEGRYRYDGTFAFLAERTGRNVVSTDAISQAMFPVGTGIKGFTSERPNLVPIMTTQAGADMILSCPRDGPCQNALKKDRELWTTEHDGKLYTENQKLFEEMSTACGFEIKPGAVVGGKPRTLMFIAKIVNDAFTFAENEGINNTLGGRLSPSTIHKFQSVIGASVHERDFSKPHQLTYWTSAFIPTAFKLTSDPLQHPENKYHLFLNHRELIYSTAHIFGTPIAFPGDLIDTLPTAVSLIFEVYDNGVKLFFWAPSKPPFEAKAKALADGVPLQELYGDHGTIISTRPSGCPAVGICPVDTLISTYLKHVEKTGTWAEICGVSKEDNFFAKGEVSLGVLEDWIQPSPVTESQKRAMPLRDQEVALAAASGPPDVGSVWPGAVTLVFTAATGALAGWAFGGYRRTQNVEAQSQYYLVSS